MTLTEYKITQMANDDLAELLTAAGIVEGHTDKEALHLKVKEAITRIAELSLDIHTMMNLLRGTKVWWGHYATTARFEETIVSIIAEFLDPLGKGAYVTLNEANPHDTLGVESLDDRLAIIIATNEQIHTVPPVHLCTIFIEDKPNGNTTNS